MDFDEVLTELGDLGRYQVILFALLCVPASFPPAMSLLSHVFISAVPDHRCRSAATPERVSLLNRKLAATENRERALKSLFIPRDSLGNFEKCLQFDIDVNSVIDQVVKEHRYINSSIIDGFVARKPWPTVECRNGWDFETDVYPETLATKFSVVCGAEWLSSTAQSFYFVGGVIGCLGLGWISDKWGRKPAFMLAVAATIIGNVAETWPPSYHAYILMRFIVGLSSPSLYQLSFLIVAEVIGPTKRYSTALICSFVDALGIAVYAVIARFLPHWQMLQAVTSLPLLLLIGYHWIVPESPRWLLSQGRVGEAEKIVQKMAKVNGVPIAPNYLQNKLAKFKPATQSSGGEKKQVGLRTIFEYPRVTLNMMVASLLWTAIALGHNGLNLAVADLTKDAHFVVFLSGVAEMPGILIAWYTMERYGRKSTMMGGLLLSGFCSSATAFVPHDQPWLMVFCAILAKMAISASFTVVYLYIGELFPTVIRGFAIGLASTTSQFGLVLTPYILFLGTLYNEGIPFVILGILSVLAALLMIILPETLNASLPTTMQQAEEYQTFKRESMKRKGVRSATKPAEENISHELRERSTRS